MPSYTPGVHLTDLRHCLPDYAIEAIREALPAFDKQIKGFAMHDAVLTGVETRTSSPIRITRNDDDLQSLNTRGLYPGRRRRGLRGRHSVGGGRRHQGGRSGGAEHQRPAEQEPAIGLPHRDDAAGCL